VNIILRPERNEQTPRALRELLPGWEMRRYPGWTSGQPDWNTDFFMVYPPAENVQNVNETYTQLRHFYQKNKPNQRRALGELGLPIAECALRILDVMDWPNAGSQRYVVRPLRHEGGQDYRVTNNPRDFREGDEYVSKLFPKEREYRMLYVHGQLTMFWQKKKAEGETDEGPWGAEGHSSFANITDWEGSYLFRNTDARTAIGNTFVARNSHIVAFDVLYSHTLRSYVVLEANVCPALYWSPTALAKVVERIQNRPRVAAAPAAQSPVVVRQPVTEGRLYPVDAAPIATGPAPAAPIQTLRDVSRNMVRIALPPRPVVEEYEVDLLGHEYRLTRPEIQHIITGLSNIIRS
jgi:hypothetical protein